MVLFAGTCLLGSPLAYLLVRQRGRILMRLDALEQRVAELTTPATAQTALDRGLSAGADAPDFELSSLDGSSVSLKQFRARKALLVFFNPDCGFCKDMVGDLISSTSAASDDDPVTFVVSIGSPERNRDLFGDSALASRVLIQSGMEVAERYKVHGTPMGYLIDEDGKIASPLAVGAEELLRLGSDHVAPAKADAATGNGGKPFKVHRGNRPLSESRLERNGLRAGTVAPQIQVPRVGGGELRLEDYLGRRVLLVFSDPECGPCQQLTPELDRLHEEDSSLCVVVISRGNVDRNQEKFGTVTFPVGLQRRWEVSKDYGMFATPIGYLIDEQGVITADVAIGPEAILALARGSVRTHLIGANWKEA